MVESTSRPWSSVPSRNRTSPPSAQAGGRCESRRLSCRRSKGSCGAIQGARQAASTITAVTSAAATVPRERRNEWTMSLSKAADHALCAAALRADPAGAAGPAGASSESATSSAMFLSGASVDAYARIDRHIKQIDDEVDGHEDRRNQQQVGGHDRDVGVLHRLEKQQPHAGPLEYRLG